MPAPNQGKSRFTAPPSFHLPSSKRPRSMTPQNNKSVMIDLISDDSEDEQPEEPQGTKQQCNQYNNLIFLKKNQK